MGNEDEIKINCILKGVAKQRFEQIKQKLGLTNDTEVIRLIISEVYAKMFEGATD